MDSAAVGMVRASLHQNVMDFVRGARRERHGTQYYTNWLNPGSQQLSDGLPIFPVHLTLNRAEAERNEQASLPAALS